MSVLCKVARLENFITKFGLHGKSFLSTFKAFLVMKETLSVKLFLCMFNWDLIEICWISYLNFVGTTFNSFSSTLITVSPDANFVLLLTLNICVSTAMVGWNVSKFNGIWRKSEFHQYAVCHTPAFSLIISQFRLF